MHGIKNAIKSNDFFLFFERKKEIKMYVDDVMITQIIYFYTFSWYCGILKISHNNYLESKEQAQMKKENQEYFRFHCTK